MCSYLVLPCQQPLVAVAVNVREHRRREGEVHRGAGVGREAYARKVEELADLRTDERQRLLEEFTAWKV